jgi:hypothetical protein
MRNRDFQTAERRQKMVTESIFHNFVVNDAEGAERIAEALSAWTEQYLECTSEEEREQMENELSQALSKNGSIRKVKHYIMLQMNAIKIKEEQYQEDVREAERSLADVTPAAPAPTPRKDVFAGIENFASSLNEMDALIHKYNEPKKKGKKKK